MEDKIEVRSSKYPYDMSSWVLEKATNMLRELAYISEKISKNSYIDSDFKDDIGDNLYPAIYDCLKLVSFSSNIEWSSDNVGIIYEEGYKGYKKVMQEHDDEIINKIDILKFCDDLEGLLKGHKTNRTLIYDLVNEYKIEDENLEKIEDMLEKLTIGDLDWETFGKHCLKYIRAIREKNL